MNTLVCHYLLYGKTSINALMIISANYGMTHAHLLLRLLVIRQSEVLRTWTGVEPKVPVVDVLPGKVGSNLSTILVPQSAFLHSPLFPSSFPEQNHQPLRELSVLHWLFLPCSTFVRA